MAKTDHHEVLRLAGPMILSNVSIATLGLVDTAVVGHLEAAYFLGAVAIASIVFNFLYWGMGFLRMGTTGMVAQCYGAKDWTQVRTVLAQSFILALVIGVTLILLQGLIADFSFSLLAHDADVATHAQAYFSIKIWGAPAALCLMTFVGCLLGMQNARATLLVSVTINVLNLVLDLVFVLGFDMDVEGVALASVISEYCGVLLAWLIVRKELQRYNGKWERRQIGDIKRFRRLLVLNHNIFLRTICLIFVFAFFTYQGSKQGEIILAANAVLLNFQTLMALFLDGFAHAIEALAGKAVGSADAAGLRRHVYVSGLWCVITAGGFTLMYSLLGPWLIGMLTDIATVRHSASTYLPWVIASPLISVWGFILDGIFIGLTRGKEMRNTMLASTVLVFLPAWYYLQPFGNHGLWLAFLVFMIARGVTLGYVYYVLDKRQLLLE